MAEAIRQALGGRPGPVLLSLAEDLLDEPIADDARLDAARPPVARATDEELRAVIEFLASARRPVILAGAGVLRARTSTELTRFAELLQVPVIAGWRRGDIISNDHAAVPRDGRLRGRPDRPRAAGRRRRAARHRVATQRADDLRLRGAARRSGLGARRPRAGWEHGFDAPTISVTADAKAFLKAANERLLGRAVLDAALVADSPGAQRCGSGRLGGRRRPSTTIAWDGPGVHPGRTIATLRRVLPDDAILTTDAGNFASWAGRGFRFRRPGTFLGPTSGAMGYGLPAAIAAALVHRDRPVVALVGDGGLAMTMAELETATRLGARVVVVVFDNERYGTIRMWQERRGTGVGVATELGSVDFAAIARACGARGARVERDADFEPALRAALAADRTTVIQVALDKAWLSIDQPPG